MSELRDLTSALRSLDKRLTSHEECLVILVRNSAQQAQWRHDQKNRVLVEDGLRLESERAMLQVQETCGAIAHKLAEVFERLENLSSTRLSDVKGLRDRVSKLELHIPSLQEEVTKT